MYEVFTSNDIIISIDIDYCRKHVRKRIVEKSHEKQILMIKTF